MTTTHSQARATPPIKKTIDVLAPRDVAFQVFTAEMTSWWQHETHHIGKVPAVECVVEPFAGGRWFERGNDGSECGWGKVLAWDPPGRVVLSWQISADWQNDPRIHSEVEVKFIDAGGGVTRVELEHRLLDTYGEKAGTMFETLEGPGGWTRVLAGYAAHVRSRS